MHLQASLSFRINEHLTTDIRLSIPDVPEPTSTKVALPYRTTTMNNGGAMTRSTHLQGHSPGVAKMLLVVLCSAIAPRSLSLDSLHQCITSTGYTAAAPPLCLWGFNFHTASVTETGYRKVEELIIQKKMVEVQILSAQSLVTPWYRWALVYNSSFSDNHHHHRCTPNDGDARIHV